MPAPSLIVLEDHPILRQSTALALQTLGHREILTAANGLEALQQLRQSGGVDIAICDVRMPEMDGMTFLRFAAQERLIRAVILVSEVSAELRRAMLHLAGIYKFQVLGELGKPLCVATLSEQINTYRSADDAVKSLPTPSISAEEVRKGFSDTKIEVHFQPKINLTTNDEHGCEALVRWRKSNKELLSPIHFLDQIREQKLQFELAKLVLERSLEFAALDKSTGRINNISLNLEIADLQNSELINHIDRRIRHYRIPASSLTFEVTEGELDHSPAISLENLIRLRLMGCRVSIDDFGTGYSSLQRLCDTPCTEIKLDASFIRRMKTNLRAREAIASTISLARHLELSVVAEGIETEGQLQLLRTLGCDIGQGYLFAPAMPVDDYLRWRSARLTSATTAIRADIR